MNGFVSTGTICKKLGTTPYYCLLYYGAYNRFEKTVT